MATNGIFVWNELVNCDIESSGPFYERLFGWERREVDAGDDVPYTIFLKDGKAIGGMLGVAESGNTQPHWEPYVHVDDVDACADLIPTLGGKVITPPHDVPEVGRVCLITDPSGAHLALVTEKTSA